MSKKRGAGVAADGLEDDRAGLSAGRPALARIKGYYRAEAAAAGTGMILAAVASAVFSSGFAVKAARVLLRAGSGSNTEASSLGPLSCGAHAYAGGRAAFGRGSSSLYHLSSMVTALIRRWPGGRSQYRVSLGTRGSSRRAM